MSTLKATTIEPATGTNVTLGTSGDTVALPGNTIVLDTWKDSGGNTLFTSDGSGTVSNVNAGLSGAGPVLIQSQTASGDASISFTSGIDSTYDRYMFVFVNINPATNGEDFTFQGSTDGGSNYNLTMTTTTFRAYNQESSSSPALTYAANQDQAQGTNYQAIGHYLGNGADLSASGVLHLFSPSSTTYIKHFYSRASVADGSATTTLNDWYSAGYFNTTSAINAVSFKMASGNFDGTLKLYGVK